MRTTIMKVKSSSFLGNGYLIIYCILFLAGFVFGQNELSHLQHIVELDTIRQYAPPEAYLPGEKLPFYGSYDPWSRRFFQDRENVQRVGQALVLDIMEGRTKEVISFCSKYIADNLASNEHLFCLTAAYCVDHQIENAKKLFLRSIESGIPLERFMAGPRRFFLPLTQSEPFKKYVQQVVQLIHGPMLGCVTDTEASFWIRTFEEISARVLVSTSPDMQNAISSGSVRSSRERDYTAVIHMQGLKPDTRYYYMILADERSQITSSLPSFRTYPEKGKQSKFYVGFGGGAGYHPPHERMWDTIASHELSAFLFLGDNVYIDLPQEASPMHDYTYYRRQSRPEFRRFTATTPIYAIWDDHDCAIDDLFFGPYIDKPDWKMSMWYLFRNNWNNPSYGGGEAQPGCWFQFSIADVDFFMLDGRFYRENYLLENPSMLGPVQKKWLLDALKKSKASFKILVSPVPWALDTKFLSKRGGPEDTWFGYQGERKEIFSFLTKHRIEGVILLSADRHRSDVRVNERPDDYPLYEFESSKLTNRHTHAHAGKYLYSYNDKCSFGLLSFNTLVKNPEVNFQIINIDDESVYSITLKKSELSY